MGRRTLMRRGGRDPRNSGSLNILSLAPYLWYRETTVNDGTNVSEWTDLSGNARHATQGTAGLRPLLVASDTNFNGRPSLNFQTDGAANFDSLNLPNLTALTAGEIYIVGKLDADPAPAGSTQSGFHSLGTTAQSTFTPTTGDTNFYDGFGTDTRKTTGDPTASLASPYVYNAISVAGEWTSNINGGQHFTTGTNTVGFPATPKIGSNNGVNVGMDGRFVELILFSAKQTAQVRASLLRYFSSRYGIAVTIP